MTWKEYWEEPVVITNGDMWMIMLMVFLHYDLHWI